MSNLRLVNDVPAAIAPTAEFHVNRGILQVVRIGVNAGGVATIPTDAGWNVQAQTTMGEFTLTSNTVQVSEAAAMLTAQVLVQDGFYDFQLLVSPGVALATITLENTWKNPVLFNVMQPSTPSAGHVIVDEHNQVNVSTVQQWTVYAIVNGITTPTVMVTNPNATVTLTADDNDEGARLTVS